MFKNKKAIICDMDGTLVPSIEMWDEVDRRLIKSFGCIPSDTIGIERSVFLGQNNSGNVYEKYAGYLLEKYGITGLTANEMSRLRSEYSLDYLRSMEFNPGVVEFLNKAKNKGYLLGLATSSSRWVLDIYNNENYNMSSKLKIYDTFDSVISKNEVKLAKPNPEIYNASADSLGVDKHRVIAIEDELVGVIAAKNAGIDVISVYESHSDHDREEIDRLSTYTAKDFMQLTRKL